MESFVRVAAVAAPLMRINIDTDQIIPARFLISQGREHLARSLFANWRYTGDDKTENPEFVLSRQPYRRAEILIADRNFGCGSSRESAPQSLRAWAIRSVIAPSFGGIFFNNCFRNGIVPVALPAEVVATLAAEVEAAQGAKPVTVDLEALAVTTPEGGRHDFVIAERPRRLRLEGLAEIGLTLGDIGAIERHRSADRVRRPWVYT